MRLRFIVNPRSGRHRRNARLQPILRQFIAAHGLDADLVLTEGPGHATALAREAADGGCERIVAVGGDGTMNEVAQALIHRPVALALVPCGSGNGLARHMGLPTSPRRALELAVDESAEVRVLDTGTAAGRPFFNVAGMGLDADVSRRFNKIVRRGLPAYARTAFAAFAGRRNQLCTIRTGNRTETLEILLISVANSEQYGNGAVIAPGARVDDGLLDLIAVRPLGIVAAAFLACRLFLGNADGSGRVRRMRGARFEIERPAGGLIHTDGECHAAGVKIDVAVVPGSLRIVCPAAPRTSRARGNSRAIPAGARAERSTFALKI
ncbi:MAG: diacylglycerol kinase family protein [Opitutaceae bacterium]|jgi:YegS/Rv2252/BmrU family lipid kinase